MHFSSLSELWAMGGYGAYVWGAVAITVITLGSLVMISRRQGKKIIKEIRNRHERQQRIDAAKNMENTL